MNAKKISIGEMGGRRLGNWEGVPMAILAGDALLVLALDVVAGSGHPAVADVIRMLSAAVQDLLDGQSADLSFEHRVEVELTEAGPNSLHARLIEPASA